MNIKATLVIYISISSCGEATKSVAVVVPPVDNPFVATYSYSNIAKNASFGESKISCLLNDTKFTEASGIGASLVNKGMFYLEEDSGNPNQIQLMNQSCSIAAIYTIGSVSNRDWEDLAVAPGPTAGASYVYVAEIGDNKSQYPTKYVYRFPEPSIAGKTLPINETITTFDKIELKLPDGVFNAEALMVDPLTKDIYIVSKDVAASVYVATYPQDLTNIITMKKIAMLPFTNVTAGDISPDGNEILLKTTQYICYWKKSGSESISELFKRTPTLVPYTIELQGEAVCFAADGSAYYTTSERPDPTVDQPLYFYKRK
ncbi:MAG: hypothetical protein ACKVOQ_10700 [Cyclobacteriaceae bacterium]